MQKKLLPLIFGAVLALSACSAPLAQTPAQTEQAVIGGPAVLVQAAPPDAALPAPSPAPLADPYLWVTAASMAAPDDDGATCTARATELPDLTVLVVPVGCGLREQIAVEVTLSTQTTIQHVGLSAVNSRNSQYLSIEQRQAGFRVVPTLTISSRGAVIYPR
jgi:hypothetical protein